MARFLFYAGALIGTVFAMCLSFLVGYDLAQKEAEEKVKDLEEENATLQLMANESQSPSHRGVHGFNFRVFP